MRIIAALVVGLCSVAGGVGLAVAAQPPSAAPHLPVRIATAEPLRTASVALPTAGALPARVDGAPCAASQAGQLGYGAHTTLVCGDTDAGLRWHVVGG